MNTFVIDADSITVPDWVEDLASFRRWAQSDDFPDHGRVCYFQGEVWVDMSREQAFSHNQVKNEYGFVLTGLAKKSRKGRYFPDGMLFTNETAELSTRPDGMFLAYDTLDAGRARFVEGAEEGFVEIEGSPDMALEVISTGSVKKDTETLMDLYWLAEVQEYWLVDARGDEPIFNIYRYASKGFQVTRKQGGWVKSAVFGKSLRLTRSLDERGDPDFTLEVK